GGIHGVGLRNPIVQPHRVTGPADVAEIGPDRTTFPVYHVAVRTVPAHHARRDSRVVTDRRHWYSCAHFLQITGDRTRLPIAHPAERWFAQTRRNHLRIAHVSNQPLGLAPQPPLS